MNLNELRDNDGARPKGKTSGRGVKGQKSHSCASIGGFEGVRCKITIVYPSEDLHILSQKKLQQ